MLGHSLFKSRAASAVETVSAKLEQAKAHHAALLAQQQEAAFAEATDEPGAADRLAELMQAIAASEQKISLLELAMAEAQRRENERLKEARLDADRSRRRALAQHLASLEKHAASYERAVSEMAQAWAEMLRSSDKARKLLLNGDDARAVDLISPQKLREYCQSQLELRAYERHPTEVRHPLPGATMAPYFNADERPKSITETLASHSEWILGQTEVAGERIAGAVGPVKEVADAAD